MGSDKVRSGRPSPADLKGPRLHQAILETPSKAGLKTRLYVANYIANRRLPPGTFVPRRISQQCKMRHSSEIKGVGRSVLVA